MRLNPATTAAPSALPAAVWEAVTAPGAGSPLAPEVAGPLARSFSADLSMVRVHAGPGASRAVEALGARAFTWGTNVFLGPGERPTDLPVMAHEVTHAVQQAGGPAVHLFGGAHGDLEREAHQASAAVMRGQAVAVGGRTSGPRVQGLFEWVSRGVRAVGRAASAAVSAVADIGSAVLERVLNFVKEHARSLPGYDLLAFILGRDPVTQQPVDRTALNLIRALVGLIPGGAQMFENLQRSGVIQRAADWFSSEIAKLNLTWPYVRGLFQQAWDALSASDLLHPGQAWEKLSAIFGPPLTRLKNFALSAGRKILEFVFEGALALAGGAAQEILAVFRRIGDVFGLIVSHPIVFLGNLVNAVKGGFKQFSANIVQHLRTALFEWLLGALQGLQLPARFDFQGILSVVLQVLGLTYAALRGILVKLIGAPAVDFIEKTFDFLMNVATKGLSAAWDKIKEFASGLADSVVEAIRDWVARSIVGAAITKLLTMFNPVGAIIQAVIGIYNTVMFFIERIQQIARLVRSILDSIESIARGNLSAAIQFVERTMANTLPVIIAFLARLVGLGNVTQEVRNIINRIQTTISNALERLARWIADRVRGLIAARQGAAPPPAGAVPAGDTPQAAAVKEATVQDIQRSTKEKKLEAVEDLHGLLAGTLTKLKPRGLQALSARVADEATLNISITVSASQPRSFVLLWAQAFHAHPPGAPEIAQLKESFQSQGYETYAAVAVDGRLIGVETSGGGHAEERILGSGIWSSALAQARTVAQARGSSELTLLINRSPCHSRCTPKLVAAVNEAKSSSPGVRFVLAATGTYEPSVEVPEQEIQRYAQEMVRDMGISLAKALVLTPKRAHLREDPADPKKGGVTTKPDIYRLQAAGWQLQQLLARPASTAAGNQWRQAIEHAARHAIAQKVGSDNSKVS